MTPHPRDAAGESPYDDRQCPYCHELVSARRYRRHVAKHEEKGDDGQQRDHATLPPGERREGDLDGVPRVYRHDTCDVETIMPEEMVRSYLADPFLYNDETFCCGCKAYVRLNRCIWTETGQRLDEYFDDLRKQATSEAPSPPPRTWRVVALLLPVVAGLAVSLLGAALTGRTGTTLIGGGVGLVVGGFTRLFIVYLRRPRGSTTSGNSPDTIRE